MREDLIETLHKKTREKLTESKTFLLIYERDTFMKYPLLGERPCVVYLVLYTSR